jgi:hypothetical protein
MKNHFFFFFFFIYTVYSFATFTLSGSTITQVVSTTDTDLSDIALIAGVTKIEVGVGTASEYIIYNIGNLNLVINGELTIDASKEMLIVESLSPTSIITVNGILNIKDFETLNSITAYNQRTAIRTTYNNNDCCGNYSLDITSTGTLNMNGGAFEGASSIYFDKDAIINIQDGRIQLITSTDPDYQIRQYSENLTANNLKLVKYAMTMIGTPIQFDGYQPSHAENGISFSSSSSSSEYVFRNYSGGGRGNRLDLGLWASRKGKIINSSDGTNVIIEKHKAGNVSSIGTWQITKEISPTILDVNGSPIQNVKMFIRDTDNGNRTDGNGYNFTDDRTYFESTDASGIISTTEVLTGAVNHLTSGSVVFDRRSKNDDTNDEFDILFYHYNKVLSKSIQKLKGIDELIFEWTLFEDTNISEQDPTIVATYTTIDDLGQLYDYAKYWKQLNETNIEIPTLNELLVKNESSILDLGDYNLVADATASSVFIVNNGTKTITVKSNTILNTSKFIGVQTAGTISVINGATLEHGYIDANGTYKFVDLKWNQATTNDVSIINNDDLSIISGPTTATNSYKNHFLVPAIIPINGIEVQIDIISNGPNLFKEIIPNDDINFVRLNIDLIDIGTELNQLKILKISERLLAKIEAINYSMIDSNTPTLIINQTITNTVADSTLQNQEEILRILYRLLSKVTAAREALRND